MLRLLSFCVITVLGCAVCPCLAEIQSHGLQFFGAYLRTPEAPEDWVVVDLRSHVMRDAAGDLDSGSINWRLRWNVRQEVQLTGMEIHRRSVNGETSPAFRFGLGTGVTMRGAGSAAGSTIDVSPIRRGDRPSLEAFRGLLANPADYSVLLITREKPEGALRGPLWLTTFDAYLAELDTRQAAQPVGGGEVFIQVFPFIARDESNRPAFGELLLQGSYALSGPVTFNRLEVLDGENGPTVFTAPLTPLASADSGIGNLPGWFRQIPSENEAGLATLVDLARRPERYWVRLATAAPAEIAVKGRVRRTDPIDIPLRFDARNVVPRPVNWEEQAVWSLRLFALRREDGSISAAIWTNDMDMRCPETVLRGPIHIHRGRAGTNGPVVFDITTMTIELPGGFGSAIGFSLNTFIPSGGFNGFLNELVHSPEEFYFDVHLSSLPDGSTRAQVGTSAVPSLRAVMPANLDAAIKTSPGGLISISGTDLAKVEGSLSGWEGAVIPDSLNSVAIGLGVFRARPMFVSATQIIAALPFDLPPGAHQLAVNNGNGLSAPIPIEVAAVAPAIFPDAIVKLADSSPVGFANPVREGDAIMVYLTGMGQTTPSLPTGGVVSLARTHQTIPATATIGGKAAEVLWAAATVGLPGFYEIALRVPPGIRVGAVPLVVKAGAASSNPVSVVVR